jgi:hypothetical protein
MMDETVFGILHRRIKERKEPLADYLVSGGAKSFEDYLRASAKHEALCSVEEDIKELEERFIDQ